MAFRSLIASAIGNSLKNALKLFCHMVLRPLLFNRGNSNNSFIVASHHQLARKTVAAEQQQAGLSFDILDKSAGTTVAIKRHLEN
jgi:hypothetical protein